MITSTQQSVVFNGIGINQPDGLIVSLRVMIGGVEVCG